MEMKKPVEVFGNFPIFIGDSLWGIREVTARAAVSQ